MRSKSVTLTFEDPARLGRLVGENSSHLDRIGRALGITARKDGGAVTLEGERDPVLIAADLVEQLHGLVERGWPIDDADIEHALRTLSGNRHAKLADLFLEEMAVRPGRRTILPRSPNQKHYLAAMRRHDMVFAVGPAGTGKTYLAMAHALTLLAQRRIRRIVLSRPAVEAGEKLGFLPGTLAEKVHPYLRPLYDALNDLTDGERAAQYVEEGTIEVAPLAFMRGRTLNDSFIILDEAQNTTPEQMKMFLTRMGFGSRMVVTGDITQIDLPAPRRSGMIHALGVLAGVPGLAVVELTADDVVRHPLVARVVAAYERAEAARRTGAPMPGDGAEAGGDSLPVSARDDAVTLPAGPEARP